MPFDSSRPVVSTPTLAQATGFPVHWIPTSTSAHVVVVVVVLMFRLAPVAVQAPRQLRRQPERIDLQAPPVELPRLPSLDSNSASSDSSPAPDSSASAPGRNAPASASSMPVVFKGSQHIVSNTQDATNSVQTILQPDIEQPPRIAAPIPVPSMVKIASPQHPPSMAAPTLSRVVQPAAPPTPTPVAQPTPPKFQHVDVDTVPLTSATELADAPKIAAYNTSGQSFQPVHPPSPPAAVKPSAPVVAVNATPAPPPPPMSVKPGGGTDSRNLVVVNAIEVHSEIAEVPAAEIHGRFEVTADPSAEGHNTGGSSNSAGVHGNGLASTDSGAGKGPATSASTTGADTAGARGKSSAGNGKSEIASAGHGAGRGAASTAGAGHGTTRGSGAGAGTGNGSGLAGNGSSPFSGMTITGGTSSSLNSAAANGTVDVHNPPGTYGMTIISSGSSGGGLRDYGVFNDGPVFTVYVDVSKLGIHGTRWSLQYSAARSVRIAHAGYMLTPPFPQTQVLPLLPPAIVAANVGRLFVFQAMLKEDGTLEGFHVLESPDTRINDPMVAGLTKWTFQPASMGNDKVPIKILMGIPIVSAMADTGISQQAGDHPPADAGVHAQ